MKIINILKRLVQKSWCCGISRDAQIEQPQIEQPLSEQPQIEQPQNSYNDTKVVSNIRRVYEEALADSKSSKAVLKFYGSDLDSFPENIKGYSYGCGHPAGRAGIIPGQIILDIGCGAGVDAVFAAQKTGPQGRVSAFDITEGMIEQAKKNSLALGLENIDFKVADASEIPYDDNTFDLALSNAVIHLVPDKARVFKDIFRVLKPHGRLVTSDIMTDNMIPKSLKRHYLASDGLFLYGGIKRDKDYYDEIWKAGFQELEVLDKVGFDVMPELERVLRKSGSMPEDEIQKNLLKAKKINFYVITYEARKKDSSELITLPCKCGQLSEHRFYEVANVTINRNLKQLLKKGRLNDFYCPFCGLNLSYPRPFMYHDMDARLMVNVFPSIMKDQKQNLEAAMARAKENAKKNFMRIELVFGPKALKKVI
jgi:SAM-dependent methyltransferase